MDRLLGIPLTRRSLLKAGIASSLAITLFPWVDSAKAQSSAGSIAKAVENKPDGLISFNAGWQIPLGDKAELLALEEKKIKEAQAKQSNEKTVSTEEAPKNIKKGWLDKAQDLWIRAKGLL